MTEMRGGLGHTTVGTNTLDAASDFDDRILAAFGAGRVSSSQEGQSTMDCGHLSLALSIPSMDSGPTSGTAEWSRSKLAPAPKS